jgi:ribosomal protein S27E
VNQTKYIDDLVNSYNLSIRCGQCGVEVVQSIGWLRSHRDMLCPACSATIVLNTSNTCREIRNVARRLEDLQAQLLTRIRKL